MSVLVMSVLVMSVLLMSVLVVSVLVMSLFAIGVLVMSVFSYSNAFFSSGNTFRSVFFPSWIVYTVLCWFRLFVGILTHFTFCCKVIIFQFLQFLFCTIFLCCSSNGPGIQRYAKYVLEGFCVRLKGSLTPPSLTKWAYNQYENIDTSCGWLKIILV